MCMSGNSKNNNIDIRHFGNIFVIENENVLEDFLNGNGRGIVNINLLETANFHKQSLSADTWKMCQPDTNIGGSSQISEAFSYEIFAQGRNAQLEKVSRVWPCVYKL